MPPVARTYLTAHSDHRAYGQELLRGVQPQVRRVERRLGGLEVRPETGGFGRRLLGGLRGPLRSAAGLMATAFAGRAVIGGLTSVINAASDLGETINKNNVVFRGSGREMLRWSKDSARAMGMSQNMALGAAATLGNLFVSMKIGTPVAANMSRRMVTLAGDLASFNNVNPEDALEALRAGLVGETEPLRKFGINLNDAALRQEALRLGLVKTTKNVLPPAARAQAAYSLILQQSTTAQGDFQRTSGGLANQQRILRAQVDNLKASLGRGLLPVATTVVSFFTTRAIPAVGTLGRRFSEAVTALGRRINLGGLNFSVDLAAMRERAKGWGAALVGGVLNGVRTGDWSQLGGIFGNALRTGLSNVAQVLGKVDWGALGSGLATRLIGAANVGQTFVSGLLNSLGGVDWLNVGKRAADMAVPFIIGFVNQLLVSLYNTARQHPLDVLLFVGSFIPAGRLAGVLEKVLGRLPILGPLLRAIMGAGRRLEGPVGAVVRSIGRFFARAIELAFPGIGDRMGRQFVRWILGLDALYGRFFRSGSRMLRGIIDGVVGSRGLVTHAVADIIRLLTLPFRLAGRWLPPAGRLLLRGLWGGIRGQFALISTSIRFLINNLLLRPFGAAGRWLLPRGQQLLRGLWSGIRALYGLVGSSIRTLINRFLLQPFAPAGRWLIGRGRQVVDGLIRGINAMRSAAGRAAQAVISAIGNAFGRLRGVVVAPLRAARGVINAFLGGLDRIARPLGIRIPWRVPGFQGGGTIPTRGTRGFRRGGEAPSLVPGSGTGDKVLIAAEPGELILPNRARDRRRLLSDPKVQRRLAEWGIDLAGDAGGAGWLRGHFANPQRGQGRRLRFQKGGFAPALTGLIGRVQRFMASTDRLPYRWGGSGPGSYDCSGLVGEIWNRLTGAASFVRRFTTGSFPAGTGFRRGLGTFTVGVRRPGSGTGHMAANLAGFRAEARSTRTGIFTGGAAKDVRSFPETWTLPRIGGLFTDAGGPGLFAVIGAMLRRLVDPALRRLGGLSGPMGRIARAAGRRLVDAAADFVRHRSGAAGGPGTGGGTIGRGGLSPAEAWIIARESGGRTTADNPTSTAFGLGQLLLGNRVHYGAMFGYNPNTTNYSQQLAMFRAYVRDRYGTAERAKAFWQSHGWYRQGGIVPVQTFDGGGALPPRSATLAINRTRAWEPVGAGPTVVLQLHHPTFLGTARQVARDLAPELDRELARLGGQVGRRNR